MANPLDRVVEMRKRVSPTYSHIFLFFPTLIIHVLSQTLIAFQTFFRRNYIQRRGRLGPALKIETPPAIRWRAVCSKKRGLRKWSVRDYL